MSLLKRQERARTRERLLTELKDYRHGKRGFIETESELLDILADVAIFLLEETTPT